MERIQQMIHDGDYFVVHAPRQMGKTTLLENMLFELESTNPNQIGVLLNFEIYRGVEAPRFYGDLCNKLKFQLVQRLHKLGPTEKTQGIISLTPATDRIGFENL